MTDLLTWLHGKLEAAEKTMEARKQEETTWRGGTNAEWRDTGCRLNKAERLELAELKSRIVIKCRCEVEMFKAVISALRLVPVLVEALQMCRCECTYWYGPQYGQLKPTAPCNRCSALARIEEEFPPEEKK
jgi:hypothetical protein